MRLLKDFLNSTPFSIKDGESYFLYDLNQVEKNIVQLRMLFINLNEIYFSVKANPSPVLLRFLSGMNVNFDVSSEKELEMGLKAAGDGHRITVSGPAKTDSFLNRISGINIKAIHLDSMEEYELVKKTQASMSIRWPLESSYSQKVGMPIEDARRIADECKTGKKLTGIHIYIGRERADKERVGTKLNEIKEFVNANQTSFIDKPKLFWGGGLPMVNHVDVSHFPQDSDFEINLECGRALVHNAGLYLTQVLEVKEKNGERIIIINGGLQHLASHFGSPRFGQQDVTVSSLKNTTEEKVEANVYGSLGISTDCLARQLPIAKDIDRGDWLAFGPAGGYGFSAGTNQFLGPNRIKELFFQDGKPVETELSSTSYLESGIYEFKNS